MKNWKLLLPLIMLALLLAACGGQSDTAVAPVAAEEDIQVTSLDKLGQTVDVQTVYDIKNRDDVYVLDVREQYEYDEKHIPNVTLLPMSEIEGRLDEIPTDKEVIITCRSGNRSGQVTQFLRQNGYDNVHNMQGGIIAWEEAGFPVER
ncbi:MAG: rhodanese-like domain-containing protein [Candidatus Promineifilaceae bacterium]|nr:rhodanese-like domain-containing protein [Candidatus Promineifilaceae bacterium]